MAKKTMKLCEIAKISVLVIENHLSLLAKWPQKVKVFCYSKIKTSGTHTYNVVLQHPPISGVVTPRYLQAQYLDNRARYIWSVHIDYQ